MGKAAETLYYLVHPTELRAIIQWKIWHDPVHERDESKESETLKRCFYFLDKTSRSFAAVIKELHPELLVPVCLFYLILRGLDTIEDDMTIPLEEKEPILKSFDKLIEKEGWSYSGNHAKEKDRDLLVEFPCVITEFKKIKPAYQDIIRDITKRMGDGMAEYCNNAEHNKNGVDTIADYERYCHYVAGLVGEGLTRLFVEAKLANEVLLQRSDLHESMGQFLQQVNILRDIREDWDDNRRFWPKEIWSKYVDKFEDLFKPENKTKAMYATSQMVLNALQKAPDVIFYLAGLREQSVFNFAAIPQSMAIATLDVCFHNPAILEKNVKITKGQACRLMLDSTQNLQVLCDVFRGYARSIAKKNDPRDPNFIEISIACGKIEQFIETVFPSQKPGAAASSSKFANAAEEEKARKEAEEAKWDTIYMGLAVLGVLAFVTGLMLWCAWMAGARFDIMFDQLKQGIFLPPKSAEQTAKVKEAFAHGEL